MNPGLLSRVTCNSNREMGNIAIPCMRSRNCQAIPIEGFREFAVLHHHPDQRTIRQSSVSSSKIACLQPTCCYENERHRALDLTKRIPVDQIWVGGFMDSFDQDSAPLFDRKHVFSGILHLLGPISMVAQTWFTFPGEPHLFNLTRGRRILR